MRLEPRILGTVCVPWTERFEFDEALFRRVVRLLIERGLPDLYIFGTAGEGHAVDGKQFRAVAAAFRDEMRRGGGLCQLGVIGLSVPQVRERIEIGLELGYESFQISFPSWGALNNREMNLFFDAILGAYPKQTFLHYNLLRGLRKMTGPEYAGVAARHSNLVATKSGANPPAQILGLLRHAPELCHFMTEQDFGMASLVGDAGLLISMGALNPRRTRRFFEAARRREGDAVRAAQLDYHALNEAIHGAVSAGAHMDGAFDKMFVKAALPAFPLRLLPPYQGASEDEFAAFLDTLRRRFPHWLPEA
jgi:dihydrodipicolinate synthase/N-acetylneuraminate lyase